MQLLDDHLWELYSTGKIAMEEMVDKGRQPSQLLEKAEAAGGSGEEMRKKMEDLGPILKT
jgi:Tfp pilus assembly ATPase PilU